MSATQKSNAIQLPENAGEILHQSFQISLLQGKKRGRFSAFPFRFMPPQITRGANPTAICLVYRQGFLGTVVKQQGTKHSKYVHPTVKIRLHQQPIPGRILHSHSYFCILHLKHNNISAVASAWNPSIALTASSPRVHSKHFDEIWLVNHVRPTRQGRHTGWARRFTLPYTLHTTNIPLKSYYRAH